MTHTVDPSANANSSPVQVKIASTTAMARQMFDREDAGYIVVSPYRFNPLGAHVDHQGGHVLARTIDQYTLLPFWPMRDNPTVALHALGDWANNHTEFTLGELTAEENWIRYAQAAAAVLHQAHDSLSGYQGCVSGTLVGAGLSSSASVVLAYLCALSHSNTINHSDADLVEWSRRVENDFLGLNNGIQDQMSVVYGRASALSLLNNRAARASWIDDPANVSDISWLVCYSGFSRELINSGFNTRVAECREAARLLDNSANILGDIDPAMANEKLSSLPDSLAKRARHYFSETDRVNRGAEAWRLGHWQAFGELMNASCHSSITCYESGSQPLIDLHEIASATPGVLGSRFSGGGYGGCLIALVEREQRDTAAELILQQYLQKYPDREQARVIHANNEGGVRVEPMP